MQFAFRMAGALRAATRRDDAHQRRQFRPSPKKTPGQHVADFFITIFCLSALFLLTLWMMGEAAVQSLSLARRGAAR